jgi:hypothetical protein
MWKRFAARCKRYWQYVLDLALVLWVARVPVVVVAVGFLILAMIPQAQDLFVEFVPATDERLPLLVFLLFLLLLFFIWAMPTHYSARLMIDTDRRLRAYAQQRQLEEQSQFLEWIERWLPRILGLLTFVAVLVAIWRSYANLPILTEEHVTRRISMWMLVLAGFLAVSGVLFFLYTVKRRNLINKAMLHWRPLASLFGPLFRLISPGSPDPAGAAGEQIRDIGRVLLILVFGLFVAILVFEADWAAEHFPRGLAVPLVLGGWLPFLAYLSALGRSWRAPVITGLAVLVAVLTSLVGDNHSVRRIDAAQVAGRPVDMSSMRLEEAVNLWMDENDCRARPAECPRPIVVAAAGGASRAGFFTASILGYFLQEASWYGRGLDENRVRKRLFAISSVSGSSVGAVMAVAALETRRDSTDHACPQKPFPLWWGQTIGNWRDCFEALTSGDFLTPDFIGLAFHDVVRFGPWRDRAAMLEEAWERRYESLITRRDQPRATDQCAGLACPFMSLRPTKGHWIPLLVLNGTSEGTGSRIVTTVLASTYTPERLADCPTSHRLPSKPGECALLAQTRYFHDLLRNGDPPENWLARFQRRWVGDYREKRKVDDVRLSTAAHNSARFPIISPPGAVRNQQHQIIDRIVDGGYVENYGALSAMELAAAIRAVQPQLAPFVLVISNDPDDLLDPADDLVVADAMEEQKYQQREQRQQLRELRQQTRIDVDDGELLTDIVTPITTFANTRTARGVLAVAQLRAALFRALPRCPERVVHVRVWPQNDETSKRSKAVSMSWWLSMPVQRHLHQQTEDGKNDNDNGEPLKLVWKALKADSTCVKPDEAQAVHAPNR